ncbi:hypothetical protein [Amycolatopsis magusensis]|uniref:Uncharacterized protein n=1 Tax=Amycolatopsis magusensis TaxID=882444 RepID=A0ABS4PXV7_9PSEU|nr:hypothetical protein [Amycolatopsis magusensis]MBP2184263.1 hypothetical protein [Amycolatopsis magusensis]
MGKRWERRRRRLVHRFSEAGPVGGALAVLLSLGKSRNSDCEDAFAETALAVDGVVSAEFECSDMFGGGWQRGKVVLRASSREEATRIVDALLRAFAAEPRLEPRWSTPQQYRNEDGAIVVGAGAAGFSGTPNIRELRDRYGKDRSQ